LFGVRIAVNTRLLQKGRLEGIGWFSKEILLRIVKQHPEHQFLFLFDRPYDPSYIFSDNVSAKVLYPQARHPVLYHFFFEYAVPMACKKWKADLFFSPDGYLSMKLNIPQVPVIHDLNFEHLPGYLRKRDAKYYRTNFPRFAQKAARILTVSDYSKKDIHQTYSIPSDLIDVAHNGASEVYHPIDQKEKEAIRAEYGNGYPYFLYVGSLHPRKNITGLLKSYELFRSSSHAKIPLLLVGQVMWSDADIQSQLQVMKYKNDVKFLGRKEQQELARLVGAALALTFIPLFEGFGIPALEAMQSGTPVITSNLTSLPEVVGEAGRLVNPRKPIEVAGAMKAIASSKEVQEKMKTIGIEQAKRFSWDTSAEIVWKSIVNASHGTP
jgi:glycosyltransferase involved in cell wall biosynthesis